MELSSLYIKFCIFVWFFLDFRTQLYFKYLLYSGKEKVHCEIVNSLFTRVVQSE